MTHTESGTRKLRLTKLAVRALPVPGKLAITWDTDLPGFGVRVSPEGRRTYFIQARTREGRSIKVTLGTAAQITAEQARDAARKHLAALALGRDPAAELRARRQAARDKRTAGKIKRATVADVWRAFERDHLPTLRAKSASAYESWWRCHIAPALGSVPLGDLSRGRIEAMIKTVAGRSGRSTANRVLAVLSAMLSFAERDEDERGQQRFPEATNCARSVKTYPEPARERELSAGELGRLLAYLDASPATEARLIELLLATAARRGEALTATWGEVDRATGWWTKPAAKVKGKKIHRAPLNAAALAVLSRHAPAGGAPADRVFQAVTEGGLERWWRAARKALGLADCHLHDLRHCAASLAINAGVSLYVVARMLGHAGSGGAITARYAHIADRALADAAAAVGDQLRVLREAEPAGHA